MHVTVELDVPLQPLDAGLELAASDLMSVLSGLDGGNKAIGDPSEGEGVNIFMVAQCVGNGGGGKRRSRGRNEERFWGLGGHVERDVGHGLVVIVERAIVEMAEARVFPGVLIGDVVKEAKDEVKEWLRGFEVEFHLVKGAHALVGILLCCNRRPHPFICWRGFLR